MSKTFGATKALREVSLSVSPGTVHALAGMNGSGKSTLVKILAGVYHADAGSVSINGSQMRGGNPKEAAAAGIAFVHQDLGLSPGLSAVENIALSRGYMVGRFGPISWRREQRAARSLLEGFDYTFDPRKPVAELSQSERTGIAIARAFGDVDRPPVVIVLDEPTASMPAAELDRLIALVERVRARGTAVVYISHHLDEIFRIAGELTVLRDGVAVYSGGLGGLDHDSLAHLIVGEDLAASATAPAARRGPAGDPVLALRGLGGRVIRDLDLEVKAGEVLGVAGLTGSGREEICGLVFGANRRRGTVKVDGRAVRSHRPAAAMEAGLAYVPANRHADALFPALSVGENVTVSGVERHVSRGAIRRRSERIEVGRWVRDMTIKTASPGEPIASLSGGNQQKAVMARVLRRKPQVLLLDDPTQGVDVAAKKLIHRRIAETADEGTAILIASTDAVELAEVCSSVVVLARGEIVGSLSAAEMSDSEIQRLVLRRRTDKDRRQEEEGR